ncbi:glycosyltransferase family 4 protein [Mangrovimonas sp. CR14]|uniref:glycosyltransferase family 4 protein n=1 Tax=Mangrovimonas sp. CR14 TaxID=2706120 RepID=UPI001422DC63|nr:glycosyltransferase family 4 protein [Mangrovimonas sp. CR14]NIK92539.1 glycosyltransferase family 4 protein [Mangrovimonas sp. CR14]
MSKRIKIAIYSGEIPSSTFIERLVDGLAQKDHAIYLFGIQKFGVHYPDNVRVLGYRTSRVFKIFYLFKYWLLLSLFNSKSKKALDVYLKEQQRFNLYSRLKTYPVLYHRPDVFHVQWAKGIGEWLWVQDFGMKLVLSLRGAHVNYSPIADLQLASMYRTFFPKVDGFHAVSNAIGKESKHYGAPSALIKTVYSGLDLTTFGFREIKSPRAVLRLLAVGRSHWKKGYGYALDACYLLKQQGLDFHFTLLGVQEDFELLYQRRDLRLEEVVNFERAVSGDLVRYYMESADVLLLPSVEEGIANVVLEAMAIGTVVIATDCGGMDEVLEDGVNGFLVPVRDPKALAEKITYVAGLPQERLEAIRREARKTIETQHRLDLMVEGMSDLYEQLTINN